MGDYSLSPAEVAAMSLGRDAFLLRGPWPAELGGRAPPDLDSRPPRRRTTPPAPDNLAAFLALLPDELLSLHQYPPPMLPFDAAVVHSDDDEERDGRRRAGAEGGLVRVVVAETEHCDRCCSICLEEMEVGAEAWAMGCSHRYHEACILEWLRRSSSCPLCRFQLMPLG